MPAQSDNVILPLDRRIARAVSRGFILMSLLLLSGWTSAQQASYSNSVLTLPAVLVQGVVYRVELQSLEQSVPAQFEVISATEALATTAELSAFLQAGVLTVMSVRVGAQSYWAQLGVVSLEPVIFRLLSGEIDDEDDDNDGLIDVLDEFPWTPDLCTSPACLQEPSSTGPDKDATLLGYTGHFRRPVISWP